jgi:hypothetical protein
MNEDEFLWDVGLRPMPPDDLAPQEREHFCASRETVKARLTNE